MQRDFLTASPPTLLSDVVYPMMAFIISRSTVKLDDEAAKKQRKEVADKYAITEALERHLFVDAGLFRAGHLAAFLSDFATERNEIMPLTFANHCIERLSYYGVLERLHINGLNGVLYQCAGSKISEKVSLRSFHNLIFGRPHVIQEVRSQTYFVEVKSGVDIAAGTAFLTQYQYNGRDWLLLVTNKHVVDPDRVEIIGILNDNGEPIDTESIKGIHCSNECDLAVISLGWANMDRQVGLEISKKNAPLLLDVMTVGYPDVGYTKSRRVLVHSGEVNGYVELLNHQTSMIISADVAPGNSGCPVVDDLGTVVGVVAEDLESPRANPLNYEGGFSNSIHHSAVPCESILDFLDSISNALELDAER